MEETQRVVHDLLSSGLATRGTAGELIFSRPQAPAVAGAVQHALEDMGFSPEAPPGPLLLAPSPSVTTETFSMPLPPAPAPALPPAPPAGPPAPAPPGQPGADLSAIFPAPAAGPAGQEIAPQYINAAGGAAAPELDMDDIAAQVGDLVQGPIGKQLRFELLRELRKELVIDRERRGRFVDG
jgi:hypothetical protein